MVYPNSGLAYSCHDKWIAQGRMEEGIERERDSLCAMKSVRKICKTFYKCWSSMRVQLCSILTHTHRHIPYTWMWAKQ